MGKSQILRRPFDLATVLAASLIHIKAPEAGEP
jgi:hypothetical protein